MLFATDLSSGSRASCAAAAPLAESLDAEVTLLHVLPPVSRAAMDPLAAEGLATVLASDRDERRGELQRMANEVFGDDVEVVCEDIVHEDPADAICQAAKDAAADCVVVGTHGRTGPKRWIFGSVAEQVVRHALTSVLVARAAGDQPPRRILCPIDFSDTSLAALRRARSWCRHFDAALTVCHVVEIPSTVATVPFELAGSITAARATSDLPARRDAARERLDALQHDELGDVETVACEVLTGHSADTAICREIERGGYDLTILGSAGSTGLLDRLLGSVSERVVRESPTSVLVVRTP